MNELYKLMKLYYDEGDEWILYENGHDKKKLKRIIVLQLVGTFVYVSVEKRESL